MFEVIISQVKTGKIRRGYFATRDEAEQYLAKEEDRILCPTRPRAKPGTLRDYRMEIVYREPPTVWQMPMPAVTVAAA